MVARILVKSFAGVGVCKRTPKLSQIGRVGQVSDGLQHLGG